MANQINEGGKAKINFQPGARAVDIQCGPGQYRFGNFFGAGCTDASRDRRSLGLGGKALWAKIRASGFQAQNPRRTRSPRPVSVSNELVSTSYGTRSPRGARSPRGTYRKY